MVWGWGALAAPDPKIQGVKKGKSGGKKRKSRGKNRKSRGKKGVTALGTAQPREGCPQNLLGTL